VETLKTPISSPNPRVPAFSAAYRLPPVAFSALLATLFYLSGIRRSIVDRNFDLMGLHQPPFFRWKLAFHLFQDAFSLFLSRAAPNPRLSQRSQAHLATLRRGPSLLLAAHFHNWEAQASVLTRLGVPLLGAARPLAAPWAERLLRALRARHSVPVVHEAVPRRALRHLRAGGCFGFLWDQHSPASLKGNPEPGTFFGRPVSLNPLPLVLLENESCPVYFGIWLPGGELRLVPLGARLHEPFDESARARLERRYHRVLEVLVRRHPQYWYGFLHARFKTLGAYRGHREQVTGDREHKTQNTEQEPPVQ
jgi:lauroyl/myristoyl acyltransferase